ncbi:MAG TPA: thioredoxin domain-containing protein [Gemmatimonadales bacterium]|nr:thioredoxin domain-containing protein [Gemmatimonadales bacterium]
MTSNRLADSPSPYLRSAAHQPVDWYPWGPEPFARAAREDKPVLLDIGAVWCHWCHVIDRESYEDPALAAVLNEHFVCVKVDRDERPDVDARYQRAVQAITRQGGWPLTGFLTPDARLFYGGTYFPPEGQAGRPGFREVLERVLEVWRNSRDQVEAQAGSLLSALAQHLDEAAPGEIPPDLLPAATARIVAAADRAHGGFGSRPKFPHASTLAVLLRRWADTGDATLRAVLHETLDGMADGGFRDQIGGGFHRYSVDERWIIPHFEKMSADNAELLTVFADASAAFDRPSWRRAAADTFRWVREVLLLPDGALAASQDADVGLEDDGDYFTWTLDELRETLSREELELAVAHFGIGTAGRMPHAPDRNVLFVAADAVRLSERYGLPKEEIAGTLDRIRARLAEARRRRVAPIVDPTPYAGWNAMLAGALIHAGPLAGDPRATESGLRALALLRGRQAEPDAVAHAPGGAAGLLEDPVHASAAALDAWEATGDGEWLRWAEALLDRTWTEHWDDRGGLLDTRRGRGGEGLLTAAAKPIQDSPNASPNGVAAICCARLFEHTRSARWRERHRAVVQAFAGLGPELGLFASTWLLAADWLAHPATHLVITGPEHDPVADELHREAVAAYVPRRVVTRLLPGRPAGLPETLAALAPSADVVRAVACVGDRCLAPAAVPAEWRERLRTLVPMPGRAG